MAFKKKAQSAAAAVGGRARRHYASRGGMKGIMGSFKPALDGGIAQVVASTANSFMKPWGGIAGLAAVGYFMKNDTLMTLAGMHAGAQLPVASLLGGVLGTNTSTTSTGAVI